MPNANIILMTRPNFETATFYGAEWFRLVKEDLVNLGITVLDLLGDLAIKTKVLEAITNNDPAYFTGVGHGNADAYTGQNYDYIWSTCDTAQLAGRDVYLLSCMTAQRLGQDIITKGGLSYLGYYPSYTFLVEQSSDIPTETQDKPFCDSNNILPMMWARTATTQTCKSTCFEFVDALIKYWEKQPDAIGLEIIKWLKVDYVTNDPQRLYGNPDSKRQVDPQHEILIRLIRKSKIRKATDLDMQVIVACPQGCNLTGQSVTILDENNGTVATAQLTYFANGVNRTDIITITKPANGRHTLRVKYTDPTHGEKYSENFIIAVQEQATLTGTVTDRTTGQPINSVDVSGSGFSGYTNAQGIYSGTIYAPGKYTVTASKAGYYSQTKTIDIPSAGTYTLDFDLLQKPTRTIKIDSTPVAGIPIKWDNTTQNTPFELKLYDGFWLVVIAPATAVVNNVTYTFKKWADGSTSRERWIYIQSDGQLTAQYEGGVARKGDSSNSSAVIITVKPKPAVEQTSLTLTLDKTEYTSGENMIFGGSLSFASDNAPMPNRTVKIYQNSALLTTVTTGIDGGYSYIQKAPTVSEPTTFTYYAEFEGDT